MTSNSPPSIQGLEQSIPSGGHKEEGLPSPLHQFQVKTLVPININGVDVSFTNVSFYMMLVVVCVFVFFGAAMRLKRLIPYRLQACAELVYEYVYDLLTQTAGPQARPYFPYVLGLFLFVLIANLIGLIPYTYTVTSQIVVTFAMALSVFVGVTVLGFVKHGLHFLTFFVPTGVPKFLYPLIVPIEIFSYFLRPISLSVRLFANMLAGHMMLKVFAGFALLMGVWGFAPLGMNVALIGFEVMVACLQAYVFTVLTCIYIENALHLHE